MSLEFLRATSEKLAKFADETAKRSALEPDDWLLALAAKNQSDAALDASLALAEAEGESSAQSLEWRLIGTRVNRGALPLGLLAKLADPLNKLLLRAAYFARNHEEPTQGTGEAFANELNLKLAGIAEGSTRLFIVGNTAPDTTGASALTEGIEHLLATLESSKHVSNFYESVGDLGERAADSLHDALKALEQEECSLEVKWHSAGGLKSHNLRFDEVVMVRSLLESTKDPVLENHRLSGFIALLASTGRLQLIQANGEKISLRFLPRIHGEFVSRFRLGEHVTLDATAKVIRDPVSGDESRQYRLDPPASSLH